MKLEGASALVTGAASGLGRATATALAGAGAEVLGLDLPSALESATPTDGVTYRIADVTVAEEVSAAVAQNNLTHPLRVVVNCAGIAPSARIVGRAGVHDAERFSRVVAVNLVGTFLVLAHGAEAMMRSPEVEDGQRGVIITTASIAAFDGQIGQAAYAASKAGVVGMTLPAARELAASGIRVCTIAPGIVDTPMFDGIADDVREALEKTVPFPRRLARPQEFARLVLAIIDNDYLNGETIRMDGALRMSAR